MEQRQALSFLNGIRWIRNTIEFSREYESAQKDHWFRVQICFLLTKSVYRRNCNRLIPIYNNKRSSNACEVKIRLWEWKRSYWLSIFLDIIPGSNHYFHNPPHTKVGNENILQVYPNKYKQKTNFRTTRSKKRRSNDERVMNS